MTKPKYMVFTKKLTEEEQRIWGQFMYDKVLQTGRISNELTKRCYNFIKQLSTKTNTNVVSDEDACEFADIVADGIKKGLEIDQDIIMFIRDNHLPIVYESPVFTIRPHLSARDNQPKNNISHGMPICTQNDDDDKDKKIKKTSKKVNLALRKTETDSPQTSDSVETVEYPSGYHEWRQACADADDEDDVDDTLTNIDQGEKDVPSEEPPHSEDFLQLIKQEKSEPVDSSQLSGHTTQFNAPTEILGDAETLRKEQELLTEDDAKSIGSSQASSVFDIHDYYTSVGETEKSLGETANENSETQNHEVPLADEIVDEVTKEECNVKDDVHSNESGSTIIDDAYLDRDEVNQDVAEDLDKDSFISLADIRNKVNNQIDHNKDNIESENKNGIVEEDVIMIDETQNVIKNECGDNEDQRDNNVNSNTSKTNLVDKSENSDDDDDVIMVDVVSSVAGKGNNSDEDKTDPEVISICSNDDYQADVEDKGDDSDSADSYIGLDELRKSNKASQEENDENSSEDVAVSNREEENPDEVPSAEEYLDKTTNEENQEKSNFLLSLDLIGKEDYNDLLKVTKVEYCRNTRASTKKILEADLAMKKLMVIESSSIDALAKDHLENSDEDSSEISESDSDDSDITGISITDSSDSDSGASRIAIEDLCNVVDRDFHDARDDYKKRYNLKDCEVILRRLPASLFSSKQKQIPSSSETESASESPGSDTNEKSREVDVNRSTSSSESEFEVNSDVPDSDSESDIVKAASDTDIDVSYDGDESDNDSTTGIERLCNVEERDYHNPYEEEMQKFNMKECYVLLTRLKDALVIEKLSKRRSKMPNINRLCDLTTLDKKRRRSSGSSDGRRERRKKLRLKKKSDEESEQSEQDMFELNDDSPERNSPHLDGREVLAEILCNEMDAMDKDKYISLSEEEGADEKKKKEKKASDKKDKMPLTAEEKEKQKWRKDPLLQGKILPDSDSENKPKIKKKVKKRELLSDSDIQEVTSGSYESDSSADIVFSVPKKNLTQASGSSSSSSSESSFSPVSAASSSDEESKDSDIEFVSKYQKTPTKKDGDTVSEPGSSKKGRRNIRAVIADEDLAEATQAARHEEEERISRLEAKSKVLSQITSSQEEEDKVKIILDVDEKTTEPIVTVDLGLCKHLKAHQVEGVKFLWDACFESVEKYKTSKGTGCILAHCMGLGKTLQVIVLIHTLFSHEALDIKHVLIVCPLSTVNNWQREFNMWLKKARNQKKFSVLTVVDKKYDKVDIVRRWRHQHGVLIMGYEAYEILTNEEKTLKKYPKFKDKLEEALVDPGPQLIVCDEGHLLKNGKTLRTQALMNISTQRRIVLTGTPLQNNLKEYYYMVQFVKPNLLGTFKEYQNAFVNPIENGQYDDSSKEDIKMMKKRIHVLHKLLKKTIHRVEVTELKTHLDTIVDYALFIQLNPLQIELYKKYLEIVYTMMDNTDANTMKKDRRFLRDYQQIGFICAHPYLLYLKETHKNRKKEYDTINPNEPDVVNSKAIPPKWYCSLCPEDVKQKLEYGHKYLVMQAIIEEAGKLGDKVLIFCSTCIELNALEHFLKTVGTASCKSWRKNVDYFRMDGTVLPSERSGMCDKFNDGNNKRARVFIMSHRVGGLGLNLTAANRVILMGVNFNPSYDTQSIYRAYRFGQTKPCYVYRLIAKDTMEEKLYQRCITKLAQFGRVVDKHQIDRHYSRNEVSEFYEMVPSVCEDRPTPNVPMDDLLANLLQRNKLIFKFHEHEALLENKPDEALSESEKNSAWEEYNTARLREIEAAKRIAANIPPTNPQLNVNPQLNINPQFNNNPPSSLGISHPALLNYMRNVMSGALNVFPENMALSTAGATLPKNLSKTLSNLSSASKAQTFVPSTSVQRTATASTAQQLYYNPSTSSTVLANTSKAPSTSTAAPLDLSQYSAAYLTALAHCVTYPGFNPQNHPKIFENFNAALRVKAATTVSASATITAPPTSRPVSIIPPIRILQQSRPQNVSTSVNVASCSSPSTGQSLNQSNLTSTVTTSLMSNPVPVTTGVKIDQQSKPQDLPVSSANVSSLPSMVVQSVSFSNLADVTASDHSYPSKWPPAEQNKQTTRPPQNMQPSDQTAQSSDRNHVQKQQITPNEGPSISQASEVQQQKIPDTTQGNSTISGSQTKTVSSNSTIRNIQSAYTSNRSTQENTSNTVASGSQLQKAGPSNSNPQIAQKPNHSNTSTPSAVPSTSVPKRPGLIVARSLFPENQKVRENSESQLRSQHAAKNNVYVVKPNSSNANSALTTASSIVSNPVAQKNMLATKRILVPLNQPNGEQVKKVLPQEPKTDKLAKNDSSQNVKPNTNFAAPADVPKIGSFAIRNKNPSSRNNISTISLDDNSNDVVIISGADQRKTAVPSVPITNSLNTTKQWYVGQSKISHVPNKETNKNISKTKPNTSSPQAQNLTKKPNSQPRESSSNARGGVSSKLTQNRKPHGSQKQAINPAAVSNKSAIQILPSTTPKSRKRRLHENDNSPNMIIIEEDANDEVQLIDRRTGEKSSISNRNPSQMKKSTKVSRKDDDVQSTKLSPNSKLKQRLKQNGITMVSSPKAMKNEVINLD